MKPNLLARTAAMILGPMIVAIPAFSIGKMHITVRVLDYVNLPADARGELQANAKRILGQAGVEVEFVDCFVGGAATGAAGCKTPLGPTDINLRILRPNLAMKSEQLGYAAMSSTGGVCVTVFTNPEQRKARYPGLTDGALLGHAAAHEIGHLLLGANSHSSSGIMRPVIRPSDEEWMARGWLLFSANQARQMRATLTARVNH